MDMNTNEFNGDIVFFAFRYALGRKSYATSLVADYLKLHIDKISQRDIKLYIKEIEETEVLGMNIDKEIWTNLKEFLKSKLD